MFDPAGERGRGQRVEIAGAKEPAELIVKIHAFELSFAMLKSGSVAQDDGKVYLERVFAVGIGEAARDVERRVEVIARRDRKSV